MKHRKLLIGTCAALAAAVGFVSVNASAAAAIQTATVSNGQLDCELELNGKVESLDEKKYFSNIAGRIATIHVREGDLVKKGDLLISYDMEKISMEQMLAELDAAADQGLYDDSKQYGSRVAGLYGEAKNTLPELEQQIQTTEAVMIMTQQALDKRRTELSQQGACLKADLAGCTMDEDDDPYEVEKARANIEKQIAQNAHDQQYDPEIIKKQDELQFLNYLMTTYKEKKSVMESQKAQTQLSLQTQGAKDRLEAEKAADLIVNEKKTNDLEAASDGIRADLDGVVTKISVSEGSSIPEGAELITIESVADTAVVCYVNKYDIINIEEGQSASAHIKNKDYECRVSRIEKKTSDDGTTAGIRVELKITEPDDSIILGIEAKAHIRTAMLAYALLVPTDAVCSDEEGDHVFVIDEDRAYKRNVVTGVSNDDMTEITEGLSAGEIVGWDEASELTDGQKVKVK